jgi:hypothetical protein
MPAGHGAVHHPTATPRTNSVRARNAGSATRLIWVANAVLPAPNDPGTALFSGPENIQKIFNQANPRALLSRPASFWEYQPPCVRGAAKQTCQFERLATFRPRRHPPRKLQGVGRAGIPVKPVDQVLRRFFAHRSVELLLPGLIGVLTQQDSNSSDVYSRVRIAWNCGPSKTTLLV